jgi:hypothetical protein
MNSINDIDWNEVLKKEARGYNDADLGKVQEVKGNYIIVQKGIIEKEKFYIPKYKVEDYDGKFLKFRLSDINLNKYQEEPTNNQYFEENFNKIENEKEITVQDADFKNKAIAVRNKEIPFQNTANNQVSEDLIKKEARGLGAEAYLGEVQEVFREYIVTEKGTIDKERYKLPKSLVKKFDKKSDTIYFNITIEEAEQYKRD